MKQFLMSGVCAFAACAAALPAQSADLGTYRPAPPPTYAPEPVSVIGWNSFYIGANAGYGWGEGSIDIGGPSFSGSTSNDPEGWFGGGQLGFDRQFGAFVLGLEGDFQFSDISNDRTADFGAGLARTTTDVDWFSTLRARLGVATSESMLVYATGGLAFADIETAGVATDGATAVAFSRDEIDTGYTVGGGVEWKLAPNISTKLEYLYVDLGEQRLTGVGSDGNSYRSTVDNDFHTVRAGLNYRF